MRVRKTGWEERWKSGGAKNEREGAENGKGGGTMGKRRKWEETRQRGGDREGKTWEI